MSRLTTTFPFGAALMVLATTMAVDADGVDEIASSPTHTQLLERQVKQKAELDRKKALSPKKEESAKNPRARIPGDLVSRSTVLSYGGVWTIVPKGAVIHVPAFLRARVDAVHEGKFVAWSDFYARNRGWIHLQDVKMEQARGEKEMPEGLSEAYAKIARVVVAVCHGGPISLRAFKGDQAAPPVPAGSGPVPVGTP